MLVISLFYISNGYTANRVVNLVVAYKTVCFAGEPRRAIAVNDQIPAPTLHFKQGDHVTINVYNRLDKETSIHWHGILVPWQMDGVLGVSQKGIPPGCVFRYQFTLHQAGTYWYHAHAGLQEQQGLYGGFLIDPPQLPDYKYTKDYVVVLSDWSNTYPDQIFANLKKDGDYYSPRFPLQPSLFRFIHDYRKADYKERKMLIDDYKMMQEMRMSIYDISDVAYDAFLLNGHTKCNPWITPVQVGDVVRLRFIGAGGVTIFHVKIPGSTMKMVHVQGNDVSPYSINEFTIAPGETYDVLVKIQKNEPYIIYAESADTVGAALGALVTSPDQFVNFSQVRPFPEPLPVTREMMANMMMAGMNHSAMNGKMKTSTMTMKTMKSHSSAHLMKMKSTNTHTMKVDSSMKIDKTMPMKHSMPMKDQYLSVTPPTKTKKQNSMTMNGNSSSHSMQMDKKSVHTMPMSKESKANKSKNHAERTAMLDKMAMSRMSTMDHGMTMNHSMNMSMPTEPTIIGDTISTPTAMSQQGMASEGITTGTKYQNLMAALPTNDPNKSVKGIIKMELFGYMDRFIWFINGVPEYKAEPIPLEPGKRYRIIFINTSMMHHPMHIHGHWFILRNGNGTYDPLLHTIDVPPGSTVTADIDTDASGQWFFHCHFLYHMVAGMSRVFQYTTLIEITNCETKPQHIVRNTAYFNRPIIRIDETRPIDMSLVKHPMAHPHGVYFSTFLDIGEDPFNNVQRITYKGIYGLDYNKLELFTNDAEIKKGTVENADIDIFYWRLISQFWAVKGGVNYFYRPATTPYWQPGIGIEGLMPYFIDTDVRGYYKSGSAKLDIELSRDTQITNNFFVRVGIRSILASKTVARAAIGSGLNQMRYIVRPYYRVMPGFNLIVEFEHEHGYGSFRNIQRRAGESTIENTLTFGFSFLF